jgi:hypothetical protein
MFNSMYSKAKDLLADGNEYENIWSELCKYGGTRGIA